jgi:predicted RNase H-like HicB family nuclease
MTRIYTAVVYRDKESGDYIASVPALPGTFTCAATMPELRANLQEAVELMLEDMAAHGETADEDVKVTLEPVEVAA